MKSKNHRSLPTDGLWRPSIHANEPQPAPPPKPAPHSASKSKKKQAGNLAGRYLTLIRKREPDKKHWSRNDLVRHCYRELGWTYEGGVGPVARAEAFRAYAQRRGYKLPAATKGKRKGKPPRAAFYDSPEWLEVRYKAIKLYGRKCMACGETDGQIHVDHIKPRSRYPELELEISNLQILCRACNLGKSAWDSTDWRPMETEQ